MSVTKYARAARLHGRRQERALDRIARCPSCGQWAFWTTGTDWLTAELDPSDCHHGTHPHETGHAA